MMAELLASAQRQDAVPSESMLTRSLLLGVIELHRQQLEPPDAPHPQYYNRAIRN